MAAEYQLAPVDHDPFAPTLMPVDHDPFVPHQFDWQQLGFRPTRGSFPEEPDPGAFGGDFETAGAAAASSAMAPAVTALGRSFVQGIDDLIHPPDYSSDPDGAVRWGLLGALGILGLRSPFARQPTRLPQGTPQPEAAAPASALEAGVPARAAPWAEHSSATLPLQAFSAAEEAATLSARAHEIHNILSHPKAGNNRTTAILRTDKGDIVAGGKVDLMPAQRRALGPGEIPAKLKGFDAEITALRHAWDAGYTPRLLVTTRDICPSCKEVIEKFGGKVSGRTAVFPPHPPADAVGIAAGFGPDRFGAQLKLFPN
jgi:hypothetical protein